MNLCLNVIIFVLFAFVAACENSDGSELHSDFVDTFETDSADFDADTFHEIQPDKKDTETETVQQISQGSETETQAETDTDTDTDTDTETRADTGTESDQCQVSLAQILKCQGNSTLYYEVRDACNDEFISDSLCVFGCTNQAECAAFLQCIGGC